MREAGKIEYSRKISREEAEKNRVLILKSLVKKFPPTGSAIICSIEGKSVPGHIIEEPCICVGPEKPHVHWYISFDQDAGLIPGAQVNFEVAQKD